MLNIALCDDNLESTLTMQKILESELILQNVDAQIIHATNKQDEIEKLIKEKKIDLLFLDVEFDNSPLNGIEFAKKLRKYNKDFYLIFLSAHQRFIYPSLVTKIFDYLVKPTNKDTIKELVARIKEEFEGNSNMFIPINKWQTIRANEILCMEKNINKTIIYTTTGKLSCSKTLDKLLDILPQNFVRCYRSFIINKDKIILLDKKTKTVTLENNIVCPINEKFITENE